VTAGAPAGRGRMRIALPRITFWRAVAALLLAAAAAAVWMRFTRGLGATTHLSDRFPWGLWIGFDVLCGVGLAAGGFTIAALVHVFHVRRFEPIVRPAVLTAYLGYLLVILALLVDLGRPLQIWHAIVMWNPRSVMFEVAWCVMLYTTVLTLEFLPALLERLRLRRALAVMRHVAVPVIILGVLLSTLHQSSLGSLYLIVPQKLYPLWYTPLLPVMFFVSAVAAGLGMVIFESTLSARAFGRGLELPVLSEVGRLAVVVLAVYATLKLTDLAGRGGLELLLVPRTETWFYWAELALGVLAPMALLAVPRVRHSGGGLFLAAVLMILGFVLNRLNVSLTGLEAYAGVHYFPTWQEIAVTMGVVALGFVAFALAARYLPVFQTSETDGGAALRHRMAEEMRLASREAA
jgi:Ni/Fe-hydrogenase subunit HybB-like protein